LYTFCFLDLHSTISSVITNVDCSIDDPDFTLQSCEWSESSASVAKNVTMTIQNESSHSNDFLQDSVDVVNACNDEEMHVKPSQAKGANKKHFCFYCKKLQTKFARHLEFVHRTEEEVKKFIYLPKGDLCFNLINLFIHLVY